MPRRSAIRLEPLTALLEQQRFTPRDTLLKHITRAEQLATELRKDVEYPEDWVVFRITAYRPDLDSPALISGNALLTDVSALVEHLCDAAHVGKDDLVVGSLSIDDLARTWQVSRKTIERYRRRGLIARRWRDDTAQVRLAFMPDVVKSFERAHEKQLARASGFSRIDTAEAKEIASTATFSSAAQPDVSMAQLAHDLAQAHGRSRPAVRRILDISRIDDSDSMLPAGGTPHLSRGKARRIARAFDFGIPPGRIADRYAVTRVTVHRAALRERVRVLQKAIPERSLQAETHDEQALAAFLGDRVVCHAPPVVPILDTRALVEAIREDAPIDAASERVLTVAHHGLAAHATRMLHDMDPVRPDKHTLDCIETDLRWMLRLRARALQWQRSLIVRTIESHTGRAFRELTPSEVVELHLAAMIGAIEAIARFDPQRGGRLAAPVSIAAHRAIATIASSSAKGRSTRAASPRVTLRDVHDRLAPWQGLFEAHPGLSGILPKLRPQDAQIIAARYGFALAPAPAHPRTIAEVAIQCNVTAPRVVGAERRARRAIRTNLAQ